MIKNRRFQFLRSLVGGMLPMVMLGFSCSSPQADSRMPSPSEETARIIELVNKRELTDMREIVRLACRNISVEQSAYLLNHQRVLYYDSISKTNPPDKLRYEGKKGFELINAGENRQAIEVLTGLLENYRNLGPSGARFIPAVKKLLALSYLRLGEQENCIENHSLGSCIVPIEADGIHTLTEGSNKAIEIYHELLSLNPGDLSSKWLMNIAYMTLDQYPESVPSQWLIPEEAFKSGWELERFQDVARSALVDVSGLAGGTCAEDFNNDGFLDIITSSWGIRDQIQYLENNGDGTFSNRTRESNLGGTYGGLNLVHTDYNNDGFADFLILRGAWFAREGEIPNSLMRNNGDGTFTDVTIEAGLLTFRPTQTATWGDINNDGWLDLFIGNESDEENLFDSEFYLNNKDGTFTDITDRLGFSGELKGWIKGCTFGDINNDGWLDLYISFLRGENKLLLNTGGDSINASRFRDISRQAGVFNPTYSFPTWFWDYDNDGWEDIFVSGYGIEYGIPELKDADLISASVVCANYLGHKTGGNPMIYRNRGDNTFEEMSAKMGMVDAIYTMGSNFGDLDNDGYLDFLLGTGEPDLRSIYPNRMFRNRDGEEFIDVTTAGGFGNIQKGHGVAFGDFDNDGDQDIYMVMGGAHEGDVFQNALFENPIGNQNSWITIKLVGTASNRAAIGARVAIQAANENGEKQAFYRTIGTGGSFGSSSLQLELGLDDAIKIERLEIIWPNKEHSRSSFTNIAVNQKIEIIEGESDWHTVEGKSFALKSGGQGETGSHAHHR